MRLRFIVVYLLASLMALPAAAQLKIDITKGHLNPVPIAITDLTATGARAQTIGQDISNVIAANLERSGLFRPIDKKAFIESIENGDSIPRFADWRQINSQALVTGTIIRWQG